jgi:hypothetical protein
MIRSKGAGFFLAAEQNNLLVENCFLICEWTDRSPGYFPYIQSGTAIMRNNVVTYPAALYNGTPTSNTYDIIGLWGAKVSEGNEFKVNGTLTGNQHFAMAYYNATVVKDKFISGTFIRPNYNSTWDNSIPFSKNDGTSASALAIPAYLNNAAALAAGLTKGSIYRTDTGELKVFFKRQCCQKWLVKSSEI